MMLSGWVEVHVSGAEFEVGTFRWTWLKHCDVSRPLRTIVQRSRAGGAVVGPYPQAPTPLPNYNITVRPALRIRNGNAPGTSSPEAPRFRGWSHFLAAEDSGARAQVAQTSVSAPQIPDKSVDRPTMLQKFTCGRYSGNWARIRNGGTCFDPRCRDLRLPQLGWKVEVSTVGEPVDGVQCSFNFLRLRRHSPRHAASKANGPLIALSSREGEGKAQSKRAGRVEAESGAV
ncbi:hypothetical protein B0H13DRAFT_1887089 [Mycena leptocephala]|nr:hypothetical protein B0H13DRAFT_1887089 [Mycena leptocephala]